VNFIILQAKIDLMYFYVPRLFTKNALKIVKWLYMSEEALKAAKGKHFISEASKKEKKGNFVLL